MWGELTARRCAKFFLAVSLRCPQKVQETYHLPDSIEAAANDRESARNHMI